MIGLFGPQRCGKTTLAKAYADKHGVQFVETSASSVFKRAGLDPAKTYGFDIRLAIQGEILKEFAAAYAAAPFGSITDRTPIDLMAYTLSECLNDNVSPSLEPRLEKYILDCFDVLNRYFSTVILVQPGIPLVKALGKAGTSKAHIEHISSLCLGLVMDERTKCAHYYIRRSMIDMDERVAALENAVGKAERVAHEQVGAYLATGGFIH